jgi:hypothetical protein
MQLTGQHLAEIVEAIRKVEGGGAGSDKRRFKRSNVVARINILSQASGRSYAAMTRDISLEGIGLIQSVPIASGEHLLLSLPGPKGVPLVVKGVVRHSRELADGVWGIGILFVAVDTPTAPGEGNTPEEIQRISAKILD